MHGDRAREKEIRPILTQCLLASSSWSSTHTLYVISAIVYSAPRRRTCLYRFPRLLRAGKQNGKGTGRGRVTWPPIDPSRRRWEGRRRQRSWLTRRWRPLVTRPRANTGRAAHLHTAVRRSRDVTSFAYSCCPRLCCWCSFSLSSIGATSLANHVAHARVSPSAADNGLLASALRCHGYCHLVSVAACFFLFLVK